MKFQQRINNLLRKYGSTPYDQYYLDLTGIRQTLIDEYYLDRSQVC
ncbi:MAG: hypothetical protein AABX04_00315 [Nanoarchaeota archaeon]